jgi:hypothetical protein
MALRPVDGPDVILEDEEEKTDEIEHGNSDISDLSHLRRCRRQRFEGAGVTYDRMLPPAEPLQFVKSADGSRGNKTRQAEYQNFQDDATRVETRLMRLLSLNSSGRKT